MSGGLPINLVVNANDGFLCISTHWQPNPSDSDSNIPGSKVIMTTYIPANPKDKCLCGSKKTFAECCQAKHYWHPVCPDNESNGFSLIMPQTATYKRVDGEKLRKQLARDERLYCVDDSEGNGFWIYWGCPIVKDEYGILCFGDIELDDNSTLTVRAMSNSRMKILLKVIRDITQGELDDVEIIYGNIDGYKIDKRQYKSKEQKARRNKSSKRRKA